MSATPTADSRIPHDAAPPYCIQRRSACRVGVLRVRRARTAPTKNRTSLSKRGVTRSEVVQGDAGPNKFVISSKSHTLYTQQINLLKNERNNKTAPTRRHSARAHGLAGSTISNTQQPTRCVHGRVHAFLARPAAMHTGSSSRAPHMQSACRVVCELSRGRSDLGCRSSEHKVRRISSLDPLPARLDEHGHRGD